MADDQGQGETSRGARMYCAALAPRENARKPKGLRKSPSVACKPSSLLSIGSGKRSQLFFVFNHTGKNIMNIKSDREMRTISLLITPEIICALGILVIA